MNQSQVEAPRTKGPLGLLSRWLPLGILDRYMIRQFLFSYAICALILFGLFILIEAVQKMDRFLKEDDPLWLVVMRYFAATVPIMFTQFLAPVLTMMASLFSVTLLNKGSELTPMKLSGLSTQRVLASHFFMAGCLMIVMIVVQDFVVPSFKDEIRTALSYERRQRMIEPPVFPDIDGQKIKIRKYWPPKKFGLGVHIDKFDPQGNLVATVSAAEIVRVSSDQGEHWELKKGIIQQWDPTNNAEPVPDLATGAYRNSFDTMRLHTEMQPIDLESADTEIPYLSYLELRNQFKRRNKLTHLNVKLHSRFAFPLANFILLLLGLPLILRRENRSVILGVTIAIVISAVYLFSTAACTELGNKGDLPPILAAWLPVLLFGALGITLFSDLD